MSEPVEWLLAGPAWVRYRTRLDLLGQSEDHPQVLAAREEMLADEQARELLAELAGWPGPPLKSHQDASHLLYKLTFLADLGLKATDPAMIPVVERILEHRSKEGPFQVLVNIPVRYGGRGEDQLAWILCDAPLIPYALLKLGLVEDDRVVAATNHLVGLIRENGWPCGVAPELDKFRGPGRKADPCPYANLLMLRALSQVPRWRDSEASRTGAETLLSLWEQRKTRRPYLFAMGSDFKKLKAPLVWYDILHVLDVLTQFPWLWGDDRLGEMIDIVKAKADERGRFTAESVWRAWKEWEFGQKRTPSRWLTLLAQRTLRRLEQR
ncbi:MAG: hypothetical protein M1358_13195 [Chloroflexi bacterium]|nr:hypothetical protein [Chloroflexota bacterium]